MKGDRHPALRLRYAKRGRIRFISHRDVARAFERALRAAAVPVAVTEGFSPRPRVSFGPALALGYESDAEYLDVALRTPAATEGLGVAVSAALPAGLVVTGVAELAPRAPALAEAVTHHTWELTLRPAGPGRAVPVATVSERVAHLRAAPVWEVSRERKGGTTVVDVRPGLERIEVREAGPAQVVVELVVGAGTEAPRPTEVIAATAPGCDARVLRRAQLIERDGVRLDPLVADAMRTPQECAP